MTHPQPPDAQRVVVERSLAGRRWYEPAAPDAVVAELVRRCGVPEMVARLLTVRGVQAEDVPRFLEPRIRDWLPDPSHLLDLDAAAERLAAAVARGERIGVLSDYDVDGATSAALVADWARQLGVPTTCRIPHRLQDGYGPSPRLLEELAAEGCRLVLILDSGTTAFDALDHARGLDLDVVVVDHHQAEAELPAALAVINPNRQDQTTPCAGLAAVGVTFLLLVGTNRVLRRRGSFAQRPEPNLLAALDLVALGTVADVVPLVGLNRAFVHQGLARASQALRPGLAALVRVAGLTPPLTAHHLGFGLAPRLNAAGRLADAALAVDLLLADHGAEADLLARRLDALNADRRAVEDAVCRAAEAIAAPQAEAGRRVLLAVGAGWHPGVLGIVAGRLAERFARPVLIGAAGDGRVVGSARAPRGLDIGAALRAAQAHGLALKAGGHARAGGFTVAADRLEEFHAAVEAVAEAPAPLDLALDAATAVAGCTAGLVAGLDRLSPFGMGNPTPRLRVLGGRLRHVRQVGEQHLRLDLASDDGASLPAIAFRAAGTALGDALAAAQGRPMQLAGRLAVDRYRGDTAVQLLLDDAALEG